MGVKIFLLSDGQVVLWTKKTQYFGVKSLPKHSVRVKCVPNSMSGWWRLCYQRGLPRLVLCEDASLINELIDSSFCRAHPVKATGSVFLALIQKNPAYGRH